MITKKSKEVWNGEIARINNYGSHYEMLIKSRSSIMLMFGKTSRGGFACAPDFNAGCHLVDFKDLFWNSEKLVSVLGKVDGITAATALYRLYKENINI
ncbi:hypothetical protein RBH29_17385 [Herbivorax sp. ANBcel31]|uniref:DUF6618 family protein n=1 Tax=Herbivorax sp. ANBcel31 TaxID=3069754 RepID=UPI0027B3C410|nr:DUF6618 family protein [Herbivorax sp. ANBcel31]MDQ2088199.1 hypothetical protein [Herbivorax sp. ANBcel31]